MLALDQTILLDEYRDNEITGSYLAYHPKELERFTFTTTEPDELVLIMLDIPFTVNATTSGAINGAVRFYLDKIDSDGLMCNGGQWAVDKLVPMNGRVSHAKAYKIAEPGEHAIITVMQGSTNNKLVVLRSRRNYQVLSFG